ncbi:cytochrome P450 [Scleroderma yunnanense]
MFEESFLHTPYSFCAIVLLVGLWVLKTFRTRGTLPLPPGPRGNGVFMSPNSKIRPTFRFAKLTEIYGPVFSLRQGSRLLVVIGRYNAAMEIMEKEGASLADRLRSVAGGEVLSGNMRMALVGNGERLRRFRRVFHAHLQPKVAATYQILQTGYARKLILDILDDPANHQKHVKGYSASVILAITYGKTTPTAYTDPEAVAINRFMDRVMNTVRPGTYLVDSYPILKYVPYYLSTLRQWHQEELSFFQSQVDTVRQQLAKGESRSCFAKYLLENQERESLNDKELAYIAGSMFGAGSDTTASAITFIVFSAALNPKAQEKVQEELDAVVGRDRLPTFADWDALPQTTAFIAETARWRPIVPGGFPHCATKDVIWNGYLIPAGTAVVANHWAIANDPEVFPNPEVFDPQRWIDMTGKVRRDIEFCTFGFGRRVCPGQHVANRSIFINTVLMLWSFRISQDPASPIDSFGFPDAVSVQPHPFKAIFEPRVSQDMLRQLCVADD